MSTFLYKTLLGATATGALLLTANLAAQASSLQRGENISPSAIAAQFNLPGDAVPSTSIGGGTRGSVQFGLPDGATPSTSIGGGTRGSVTFGLPDGATPITSIGGGTRGSVTFGLPDGATPSTSIGGGTRGSVTFGLPDDATPSTSIGGGTREGVQFGLPGGSTPSTGIGAGTREGGVPLLTALVPPTQHGNTVSGRPTIFAYVPPMGAKEVFFSLQDEDGNAFYHATLPVSADGGTIAIELPADAPELEVGRNYLWYLAPLQAGTILRPDNYAVVGWIKRVESTIDEQAFASSPIELATAYANAGIWYDTLEVLASAQRSDPSNQALASEWNDLLQQVGLEAIAAQPLTDWL
jgi:Domain of Unknown Function (DUF928)